jgi:hypothetical protein
MNEPKQLSPGQRRIHACVLAAMEEIANRGIAKMSSANLGGSTVKFRGIEIAMNEMSVVLIHSGITVTPEYSELTIAERAKAEAGKFTRFATVKGSYTFEADDGSTVKATYYGEAMDSGDKAVIKAQSVAFRTALFQTFVVPTMAMDTEVDDGEQEAPALPADAKLAAESGVETYQAFWKKATPARKREIGAEAHEALKALAVQVDQRQ